MNRLLFFICLLSAFVMTACSGQSTKEVPLNTKIGQMIIIGYNNDEAISDTFYNDILNNRVSGIIFYKHHIKNHSDIKNKIDKLNNIVSEHPLFIMLDQEGGLVSRITKDNGFEDYPSAQYVGENYKKEISYETYSKMAKDLSAVGFNFNLAPCVDIKTTPVSIIAKKKRIYGTNPDIVYMHSYEFIKAHNDSNVITAIKHFPGLGSAGEDSHYTLPDITNTWSEKELIPFSQIINKYPNQPVMIGHALNKNIDNENISSSSEKTIKLLTKMNHKGIVITDALDMDAIDDKEIKDILVKAVNAGVDLFIFPNHKFYKDNPSKYMTPEMFMQIMNDAVASGEISIDQINKSYNKIITLKKRINRGNNE